MTDREVDSAETARRESAARDVLAAVGAALDKASATLDDLEREDLLGPALKRWCDDLADMAGGVAREIGERDEEGRRELARACLSDARGELLLREEAGTGGDDHSPATGSKNDDAATLATHGAAEAMAALSEDDVVGAVNMAETILLDVEEALRSVGNDEAEEIADVGLTVARMFVWMLQSIQGSVTPAQLAGTDGQVINSSQVEILDGENIDQTSTDSGAGKPAARTIPSSGAQQPSNQQRMRVLWPPLGPAVASAGKWGTDAATKSPVLSAALGLALWPAAIMAAFIGAPFLAADWALQKGYDASKDGPVVEAAEKGAANLYQVGKLYYLCGKLVLRQGWRVGMRQVDRRGGVGAVAMDIGSMAVDRALHPLETATMAWHGLSWGAGVLRDATVFLKQVATGEVPVGTVPVDLH